MILLQQKLALVLSF